MVTLAVLVLLVVAGFLWWQGDSAVVDDVALTTGIEQVEVESADGTTQIHPLEPEDQAVVMIEQQVTAVASLPAAEPAAPEAVSVVASQAAAPVEPSVAVVVTPTALSAAPAEVASAAATPAVSASAAVAEPSAAPALASQVVVGQGEGLLDIRFSANCWAQVTDADGKVLFSALKRAGENISVAVKLPLELRLGYASGAQVSFNGKAVDITPYTTGETARLKLGL
jgi:cytoskeleton protein RodZ